MPFDGIVVKSAADELNKLLAGGRIEKIFQPEPDEIILNIRSRGGSFRLLLSANAASPRIYVTVSGRENPATPPGFCMMLRKHLSGGKIISAEAHDYERIISLKIESVNELGDIGVKQLVIEIMGKYSNIMLINSSGVIMDAIKHVDSSISSVREVMPARVYAPPPPQDKCSPESARLAAFPMPQPESNFTAAKFLLQNILGFSPLLCKEICLRAGVDPDAKAALLKPDELAALQDVLDAIAVELRDGRFAPCIIYGDKNKKQLLDFHCLSIKHIGHAEAMPSLSEAADLFFEESSKAERQKQKKGAITKVLTNAIERCAKKVSLQEDSLRELADRDNLRLYGELLTANSHAVERGAKEALLVNYYSPDAEKVAIPLDPALNAQQNAQKYFKKYAKAKRAFTETQTHLESSRSELEYLESVLSLLDNAETLQEIGEIREELAAEGYISAAAGKKAPKSKPSEPLSFVSTEGYNIYVGRNNRQNDRLTLKSAAGGDMWLHTRNIPGAHVIIVRKGSGFTERVLYEAACLAAGYSRAQLSDNVPVDYTLAKYVKKPSGSKPGKVIYTDFKTLNAQPVKDIKEIKHD